MDNDAPNVFISETGEIIMVNSFELDDDELDDIVWMESVRDRTQKKYQTKDIYQMIRRDISRNELIKYIDVIHHLLYDYGIDS